MTDFSSQSQRPRTTRRERAGAAEAGGRYRAAEGARMAQPQRARSRSHAAPSRERASARFHARATEQARPRTAGAATARTRSRDRAAAPNVSPVQAVLGWASSHLMICIVVGVIVLMLGVLYSPAKALYGARRTNAVLAQRLDAATSSAQTLQSEVDSLMTREGIEDEARRRGYVEEGDTAVDMDGVTDSGSATTDESVTSDSSASTGEEEPTPWYTSVLDFIFGYDPSTQGVG